MQTGKTVFLGVEGAGKTTLAMALVKAFAKHRDEGWYLRPVDRGAYNFATVAPEDFVSGHFPRQTANSRELTWRIERDGAEVGGFEILDYPGEVYRLAFLNADDEANPEAIRARQAAGAAEIETLRKAVESAGHVFVLFNLQDALNLDTNDANRGAVWVTNECLHAVKALPSKPKVTLVFTQVDRYAEQGDFLHEFTPKDLDLIGHDHADVDWTMVSVLVPPDSEFGVDAFVRRCTGLVEFGVASGRPKTVLKPNALDRLRAALPTPESAPVAPSPMTAAKEPPTVPETSAPEVCPPAEKKPAVHRVRRPMTLILLAVLCGMLVSVGRMVWQESQRRQARERQVQAEQARLKNEAEQQKTLAVEKARLEAEIARVAAERKKMEEEAALRRAEEEARAQKIEDAKRKAEEERQRLEQEEKERAAREKAAAEKARQEVEEAAAEQRRRTEEAYQQAIVKKSPQDAHELLCQAAEDGHAEAQYRLACVYDIWGWGGWKPEEGVKVHWSKWMRQIDLPTNSTTVAVSRPAKNAVEFQQLALNWYRTALSNGVAEAAAALKRHQAEGERK